MKDAQAVTATQFTVRRPPDDRVPTAIFVLGIIVVELVISWSYNQFMFSREMLAALSVGELDAVRAEQALRMSEKFAWLGYIAITPSVLIRLVIVALCLQASVLFIESTSVGLGVVFRAASLAHLPKLAESAMGWLWFLASGEAQRVELLRSGNPLSLAVFLPLEGPLSPLRMLAMQVSFASAAWIVISARVIESELRLPRWSLLVTCALAWAAMAASRFGFAQIIAALV